MLKPKLLGSLILLYLVLYKLWEFSVVLMGAQPTVHTGPASYSAVLGYVLIVLFGIVLLSYSVGSVGLLVRRKWSAVVVFYTAIVEATILLLGGAVFLYAKISGSFGDVPPWGILPLLLLLLFPAGIGYAARNLRNNPDLWQTPTKTTPSSFESADQMREGVIRPAILPKAFWTVVATGLLLPTILALIVMAVLGRGFHIDGGDLFLFLLVTVPFALPYIVLAFIGRAELRKAFEEGGYKAVQRSYVLAGIFVGMTTYFAPTLYHSFAYREAAAVLLYAPFAPFIVALFGVVVGAIVGQIAYSAWKYLRRSYVVYGEQGPTSRGQGHGWWIVGLAIATAVVSVILFKTTEPGW